MTYKNIPSITDLFNKPDVKKYNNQSTELLSNLRLAITIMDYCPLSFDKHEIQATLELNGICREEAAAIINLLPALD